MLEKTDVTYRTVVMVKFFLRCVPNMIFRLTNWGGPHRGRKAVVTLTLTGRLGTCHTKTGYNAQMFLTNTTRKSVRRSCRAAGHRRRTRPPARIRAAFDCHFASTVIIAASLTCTRRVRANRISTRLPMLKRLLLRPTEKTMTLVLSAIDCANTRA